MSLNLFLCPLEHPDNISKPERLEVIIPPNAAAEALRGNGSAPSPIPPLPERTPESFVLANNAGRSTTVFPSLSVPVEMVVQKSEEREWSGRSVDTPVDKMSWTRSKSLKVKMTTLSVSPQDTVSPPVTLPPPVRYSVPAPCTSVNLPPPPPPPYPLAPSLSPPGSDNLTPPLPERTPESFFLVTQEVDQNSAPCLQSQSNSQTTSTQQRIGTSSEWAGNSQPERFLDGIMNRSKVTDIDRLWVL
ncbi:unnamed protein product [Oncorhynchus mykiss]|uniref:Uncharacterized protein n=1 Tax=Oncorhynchus mykiss TaxID=8022 RepID=A0A060Z6A3_ONCMY|nr:unnamed protein product [Oncorhynchus mykiss]